MSSEVDDPTGLKCQRFPNIFNLMSFATFETRIHSHQVEAESRQKRGIGLIKLIEAESRHKWVALARMRLTSVTKARKISDRQAASDSCTAQSHQELV